MKVVGAEAVDVKAVKEMRIKVLNIFMAISFIFLGAGLFYVQVLKGPYYQRLGRGNIIRLVPVAAPRGIVKDVRGQILVDNRLAFDLVAIPQELKDPQKIFQALSQILGIPEEGLHKNYEKGYLAPFAPVDLLSNLSKDKAFVLEQMNLDLPGVMVEARPLRRYVYEEAASHLLGYVGLIQGGELARLKMYGYTRRDLIGRGGIEESYDGYLRGEDGGIQVVVDNRGRQVKILGSRPPSKGKDLQLTIDIRLQEFIYNLLKGKKGACVVLDPNDGQVKAMVSYPGFDPNIFVDPDNPEALLRLLKSSSSPLLNRAIQSQYTLGSIVKVAIASAGLETQDISSNTAFFCGGTYQLGGRQFNCWFKEGHGRQDVRQALVHSCNIFFFSLGQRLGIQTLSQFAKDFGLGQTTGIDLPEEAIGLVPDGNWKKRVKAEAWYQGDTLNFAVGQGFLLASPLQAAVMISVIANGGKVVRPYLVKSIESVEAGGSRLRSTGLSQKTLRIVREALEGVVEEPSGTGIWARVEGLKVAGKTGTAQIAGGEPHAWFVGYAPAQDPKASLAIILEHGGYGGEEAAPLAREIFKKMKEYEML